LEKLKKDLKSKFRAFWSPGIRFLIFSHFFFLKKLLGDSKMPPDCMALGRHDMPPGKSSVVLFRLVEHNKEALEPQLLPMHVMVVQRFVRRVVGAKTEEEAREVFYCLGGTFYLAPSLARVVNKRTNETARCLQKHFDLSRELVGEIQNRHLSFQTRRNSSKASFKTLQFAICFNY